MDAEKLKRMAVVLRTLKERRKDLRRRLDYAHLLQVEYDEIDAVISELEYEAILAHESDLADRENDMLGCSESKPFKKVDKKRVKD